MKILIGVLLGMAASGCQAGFDRAGMIGQLQQDQPIVFDDADILRIEQARPQLQCPFRLAVVPPTLFNHRVYGEPGETEGQRREIMAWGDRLRREGVVSDLIIIPDILTSQSHSQNSIKDIRVAAARLQADAVLILRSTTDTDAYVNPLSVLDLTLVGMFLVPAHHRDALTIVEGMVLDNRNQYVYFAGSAEGKGATLAPLASVDAKDAVKDSRCEALKAFGELLVREGRRINGAGAAPRYDTPGQR
ncbi:MAG: hypothetical protein JO332_08865 [Planctomycetaceae bacterium]|nr:hypothetical protein [Planctomycetaceae bacterium]